MKLTIIESPFSGEVDRNTEYARRCVKDSLLRKESPIASHLLLTQVLDDNDPDERALGMAAGHAWYHLADLCAVYVDYGISKGMIKGMQAACAAGVEIDCRRIGVTKSRVVELPTEGTAQRIIMAAKV